MFDHLGLQADDVSATVDFYLRVFAPLHFVEAVRFDAPGGPVVGISSGGAPELWVSPFTEGGRRESHVAFTATDRAQVDAVYAAAQEAGAEILHAPREWPEYHPGYYAVFVRDPDGNNVEAVTHG